MWFWSIKCRFFFRLSFDVRSHRSEEERGKKTFTLIDDWWIGRKNERTTHEMRDTISNLKVIEKMRFTWRPTNVKLIHETRFKIVKTKFHCFYFLLIVIFMISLSLATWNRPSFSHKRQFNNLRIDVFSNFIFYSFRKWTMKKSSWNDVMNLSMSRFNSV